jgi:hypothetical protein
MNKFFPQSRVLVVLLVVSLLGACSQPAPSAAPLPTDVPEVNTPEPSATPSSTLVTFTENGVTVDIVAELKPSGQGWLSGTFTPLEAGFHLYSNDLPRTGLNGQGRPTLLDIISLGNIRVTGALVANQPTILWAQGLLVYPDGPVILSWPIEWAGNSTSAPTELSITYMACTKEICLKLVADRRVLVEIPDPNAVHG